MKKYAIFYLFFSVCLLNFSALNAQSSAATTGEKDRLNVLKTNILSPFSIGYERGLGKHFSLGAYYLYFPAVSIGTSTDKTGSVALSHPSTGYTIEARLYTSKTQPALSGFYVGAYYLFRVLDVTVDKMTATTHIKARVPSDLSTYGLMIGRQKIRAGGFTTSFNFGLGYYRFSNVPTLTGDDGTDNSKLANRLSKLRTGVGPRLNYTLGYAF